MYPETEPVCEDEDEWCSGTLHLGPCPYDEDLYGATEPLIWLCDEHIRYRADHL